MSLVPCAVRTLSEPTGVLEGPCWHYAALMNFRRARSEMERSQSELDAFALWAGGLTPKVSDLFIRAQQAEALSEHAIALEALEWS